MDVLITVTAKHVCTLRVQGLHAKHCRIFCVLCSLKEDSKQFYGVELFDHSDTPKVYAVTKTYLPTRQ